MHKIGILIIFAFLFTGCKPKFTVNTSFYYWKTEYQNGKTENNYLSRFNSKSLYVRIMDVDIDPISLEPVPISAIKFNEPIPQNTAIIPVVYLVNRIFNNLDSIQTLTLANRIAKFVTAKVEQAGKKNYDELQIDCDWTKTTRDKYFIFLNQLKKNPLLKNKQISVTLRLHQVKNLASSGIPPVKKAILMCYNMGNLRQYGDQNSILDMKQMNTYLKTDLESYPLKLDVALPLFSWAVVFRNQQYAGISRRIGLTQLNDRKIFKQRGQSILYDLLIDFPQAGLKKGDMVRWEDISLSNLLDASKFLSRYLKSEDRNLVFYHLDSDLLKHFKYDDLKEVLDCF